MMSPSSYILNIGHCDAFEDFVKQYRVCGPVRFTYPMGLVGGLQLLPSSLCAM